MDTRTDTQPNNRSPEQRTYDDAERAYTDACDTYYAARDAYFDSERALDIAYTAREHALSDVLRTRTDA